MVMQANIDIGLCWFLVFLSFQTSILLKKKNVNFEYILLMMANIDNIFKCIAICVLCRIQFKTKTIVTIIIPKEQEFESRNKNVSSKMIPSISFL